MAPTTPATNAPHLRPLIVRLRNWIGDVTLGIPMLHRLQQQGHALQLIGKPWAADLLEGYGWPVHPQPATLAERVRLMRRLRQSASATDPTFDRRLNALCLPYSMSSALEFRLAGLRALGHAHESRSPLLARAVRRTRGLHALAEYWELGSALLETPAPLPERIGLRLSDRHRQTAREVRAANGIGADSIFIFPFAGGTFEKLDKSWPGFEDFVARRLPAFQRPLVLCPGPGEAELARSRFPGVQVMPQIELGTYAALLAEAPLLIANDTGPGHLAAAVGTPVVSVLGPTDPSLWRAWGPTVTVVQGQPGWPGEDAVYAAVKQALVHAV